MKRPISDIAFTSAVEEAEVIIHAKRNSIAL